MKIKKLNAILYVLITLIITLISKTTFARPGGGHGFHGGGGHGGGHFGGSGSSSFYHHSGDVDGILGLIIYIIEFLFQIIIEYPITVSTIIFVVLWIKFKD